MSKLLVNLMISRSTWRSPALLMCGLALAALAGCESSSIPGGGWRTHAVMRDQSTNARFTIYGSLDPLLPHVDDTPLLDRVLYGPSDYGKAVLRNPQGMILSGSRLLVCDQGRQDVVEIDLVTGQSTFFCDDDQKPRSPVDLAASADGRVYVADTTVRSVLEYESTGDFVASLSSSLATDRFRPCSVCVHGSTLYVGDLGTRAIHRFDLNTRQWQGSIQPPANQPGLIAPVGLTVSDRGDLYIADSIQRTVFQVDSGGQWKETIGQPGRGDGEFVRPKQVVWSPSGYLFVVDSGRQSVMVFTDGGRFVAELHEREGKWNGWTLPAGLLAVSRTDLAPLMQSETGQSGSPLTDHYVIVSDALGLASLTLVGID